MEAASWLRAQVPVELCDVAAGVSAIPDGVMLVLAIVAVLAFSVPGSHYVLRTFPGLLPWMRRTRVIRCLIANYDGADAVFQALYLVGVVGAMVGVWLVHLLAAHEGSGGLLWALLASYVGVGISVWVNGGLQFADPAPLAAASAQPQAAVQRQLFLHAVVGAALGALVLAVPGQCPIPAVT